MHDFYLMQEYGALFYETSAKSGLSVRESLEAMSRWINEDLSIDLCLFNNMHPYNFIAVAVSRLLREREDIELEKAVKLDEMVEEGEKKRGCCN